MTEPKDKVHTIGRIEIKVSCHFGMWKIFIKDQKETVRFPLMNRDEDEAKALGAILADMIRNEMDRVQGLE